MGRRKTTKTNKVVRKSTGESTIEKEDQSPDVNEGSEDDFVPPTAPARNLRKRTRQAGETLMNEAKGRSAVKRSAEPSSNPGLSQPTPKKGRRSVNQLNGQTKKSVPNKKPSKVLKIKEEVVKNEDENVADDSTNKKAQVKAKACTRERGGAKIKIELSDHDETNSDAENIEENESSDDSGGSDDEWQPDKITKSKRKLREISDDDSEFEEENNAESSKKPSKTRGRKAVNSIDKVNSGSNLPKAVGLLASQVRKEMLTRTKPSTSKRCPSKFMTNSLLSERGVVSAQLRNPPGKMTFMQSSWKPVPMKEGFSSGSEDEWEEVGEVEPLAGNEVGASGREGVEVTIHAPKRKKEESEESKWAKFIRQQVNRKILKRQVDCHKMHILCYISHLRGWMRMIVRSEFLIPQCLSMIPSGYLAASELSFDPALMERFLKWFKSAFSPSKSAYHANVTMRDAQTERLGRLIEDKVYEDDRDLALIVLVCVLAMKQSARLCLSCQPMPQKPNLENLARIFKSKQTGEKPSTSKEKNKKECRKKSKSSKKNESDNNGSLSDEYVEDMKGNSRKKSPKKKKSPQKIKAKRDYWVEYWDEMLEKWICVDPWKGTVDMPESFEADATSPMHYVIAIDNEMGMRDVTARYASKFLTQDARRLRIDQEWFNATMKPFRSKNRARERIENVFIHDFLIAKPMPVTIAEFKNHPLYALKKDLLKFEAIFPEDQKPITTLQKGVEVYPRSSVRHLQGSLNWIKEARSIREGELPYKVVKARPNIRVPEDQREPRSLDVFGYWQTVPYIPPLVKNGEIPRNDYGNLYVYKPCMTPKGCVHLRLDGLASLARQRNIECVPAVVGWDFHKGGNHPILDGCVVFTKDAPRLTAMWEEQFQKKKLNAIKRRKERARKNWRKLYRGVILMKRVRAEFLCGDQRYVDADEELCGIAPEEEEETPANDDLAMAWPRTDFNLPVGNSADQDQL